MTEKLCDACGVQPAVVFDIGVIHDDLTCVKTDICHRCWLLNWGEAEAERPEDATVLAWIEMTLRNLDAYKKKLTETSREENEP